jgi:hypothetical protein
LSDKRLKQNVGKGEYVSSLRLAVKRCATARISDGSTTPPAQRLENGWAKQDDRMA